MLRKKVRPMTQDETETFLRLYFIEKSGKPIDMKRAGALLQIFEHRLEWAGLESRVTESLMLWCAFLSKGSPGNCVMWAYQLAYLSEKVYKGLISITQWADEFPNGIPTDEHYESCWEKQKNNSYNFLDNIDYWPGKEKEQHLIKLFNIQGI